MSDASTSTPTSSTPNAENPNPPPGTYHKPIYQVETTGSLWQDMMVAWKRVNVKDDVQNLGKIPCARKSLLSGIASGVGVGVLRATSVGIMPACNWAVGTFMIVSLGSWQICQNAIAEERRKIAHVVDEMPKRMMLKQKDGSEGGSPSSNPS